MGVDFCNCPRVCPKLFPELIKVKEGFILSPKIISPLIILVVFAAITVLSVLNVSFILAVSPLICRSSILTGRSIANKPVNAFR